MKSSGRRCVFRLDKDDRDLHPRAVSSKRGRGNFRTKVLLMIIVLGPMPLRIWHVSSRHSSSSTVPSSVRNTMCPASSGAAQRQMRPSASACGGQGHRTWHNWTEAVRERRWSLSRQPSTASRHNTLAICRCSSERCPRPVPGGDAISAVPPLIRTLFSSLLSPESSR